MELSAGEARDLPLQRVAMTNLVAKILVIESKEFSIQYNRCSCPPECALPPFLVIAQHMSLVYGHQVWKIFFEL